MPRVLIGLGSNLGDRRQQLDEAAAALARMPGSRVAAQSSWYETSAVGGPEQAAYLNGCVLLETVAAPDRVLHELQAIENAQGRVRSVAWGPRTLDLDLLLYDDAIVRTERLRIPHPRLAFRKFVLRGATEIASTWLHPLLERTLGALAKHLELAKNYAAAVGLPTGFRTQFVGEAADVAAARLVEPTPPGIAATVDEVGSHGLDRATALEFLQARDVAVRRSIVESAGRWVLDDAWSAAEEAELLRRFDDDAERRAVIAARRAAAVADLTPKLLICLGTKQTGTHAAALTIRQELGTNVSLPPVVDVDISDREGAMHEIAAALEAAA